MKSAIFRCNYKDNFTGYNEGYKYILLIYTKVLFFLIQGVFQVRGESQVCIWIEMTLGKITFERVMNDTFHHDIYFIAAKVNMTRDHSQNQNS